jgi:site-specific DNA-methyltransferase (adenine-specific)
MVTGVLLNGDCLELVPRLVEADADRFDLIYLDPPFNTGGRHGHRDRRGHRAHGATAYADRWGGIDGFLSMLEPRLMGLWQVLSPRGSLWLHLDHRTVHDAKVLADRMFGRRSFRGEVIWVPGNGGRRRHGPNLTHQTILIFAPGRAIYNAGDAALHEPYAATSLKMHFGNVDAEGRRYRERQVGGRTYRYYADQGRQLGSVWTDCPAMRANTPLLAETTGYPTQKPEKLLDRILRAATLPSSRVLDPMCGSGTTLAVAARLGRRWAGVDTSPVAIEVTRKRLGLPVLRDRSER